MTTGQQIQAEWQKTAKEISERVAAAKRESDKGWQQYQDRINSLLWHITAGQIEHAMLSEVR